MKPQPEIAVVIPTRDREARLASALQALADQTLPKERFEVVVVRDGSQAGPLASAPADLPVRFLTRPGTSGPTAKRNMGWRATTAPVVAFTDDDCRPAPDWLERVLDAHTEGRFLAGRTEADPEEAHLLRGLARSRVVVGSNPWFPGCNIAYPRSLLERLDGFDESFYFGGEDTDLALRAQEAGAVAEYVDEALVWHAVLPRTVPGAVREAVAWPSLPLVVARHPRQRRYLYLRAFRNKSHGTLTFAALGLALFRRRPVLAAMSCLPYLRHKLDEPFSQDPVRLATVIRAGGYFPVWLLIDIAEVAATVRGAVAHRVLML